MKLVGVLAGLVVLMVGASAAIGGVSSGDIADPATRQASEKVVALMNENSSLGGVASGGVELVEVVGVKTQVVAGLRYVFELVVRDASGALHRVEADMWSRPWLEARNNPNDPPYKLTSVKLLS